MPEMMKSDVQPSLTGTLETRSPIGRYILCRWPKERFFCVISASIPRWGVSIFFGHLVSYAKEQMGYSLSLQLLFLYPSSPPPTQHPPTHTHSPKILYVSITTPYLRYLSGTNSSRSTDNMLLKVKCLCPSRQILRLQKWALEFWSPAFHRFADGHHQPTKE